MFINRNATKRQVAKSKEDEEKADREKERARAELLEMRAERAAMIPAAGDHDGLIEYLLTTEADDIPFETARCLPLLDDAFFAYLSKSIGELRFKETKSEEEEDRMDELQLIQTMVKNTVDALEKEKETLVDPAAKLKKLLTSPDKKATILEMAGDNEIDVPLLLLLKTNIAAAKSAKQPEAVEFMEKIFQACQRYATLPAAPAGADAGGATIDAEAAPAKKKTVTVEDLQATGREGLLEDTATTRKSGLIIDPNAAPPSSDAQEIAKKAKGLIL